MRSAWFWGTKEWAKYQLAYYHGHVLDEYKSSPLASDHEFEWTDENRRLYELSVHQTQVLDLTVPLEELWRGVRKSYHSIIHRANEQWEIEEVGVGGTADYQRLHAQANGGQPRPDATYECQRQWIDSGDGLLVVAHDWDDLQMSVAASYWILYEWCAYYMSGPSIEKNVQHAVIWRSLELLKDKGIRLVELGQIDGETEKERNIGIFKRGFGGTTMPFTVATRRTVCA
jgi:hypothetical protein